MSIEFLLVFSWFYVGFFSVLWDWHNDLGQWRYDVAIMGSVGGCAIAFMILVTRLIKWVDPPKPS